VSTDRIALSIKAEDLALALDRHHDFRVQRRLADMDRRASAGGHAEGLAGLALAIRTSGDDHRRHQMVELAVQRFRLDERSRIVETGRRRTWLETPPTPISGPLARYSDLVDADLIGRAIPDGEATGLILDVDFVVTHDAAFARPFVERRLPSAAGRAWVCSLADMDWRKQGFDGRRLAELLGPMGWFYDEHRADTDVTALLHLLDYAFGQDATVAERVLSRAGRADWVVDADDVPVSAREVLLERGYRWDGFRRIWTASVDDDAVSDEIGWASLMLYGGRREPVARRVTWFERYA
jgi:DNA polymerase-3 subunit epsilon